MYPQQSTRWTSIGNLNKNLEIIQQLREFQRMWCEYFMASFPEILRGSKIWKIRNRENSYLRHRDALSGSISNDGISHLFNSFNFWLKLSYFHPRRESHWTCILCYLQTCIFSPHSRRYWVWSPVLPWSLLSWPWQLLRSLGSSESSVAALYSSPPPAIILQ